MKNIQWVIITLILAAGLSAFGLWIKDTNASALSQPEQSQSPAKESGITATKTSSIRKVVIDPGHGGRFPGARGQNGLSEKYIVLDISLKLKSLLEAKGIKVVMTRETDQQLSLNLKKDLKSRVAIANRENPDLFISIHANWYKDPSIRGFEIYYSNRKRIPEIKSETIDFASEVREALRSLFRYRSTKSRDLQVIRNVRCPAILVEVEYLSNRSACRNLAQESYRARIAERLCEAILDFGKDNEKPSLDE